ncbi:MAG TPA: histidine kinase [Thermoanaerobaculia bacterium]|nr:histidine kinase [Thermoanaerobaculia bacterium]
MTWRRNAWLGVALFWTLFGVLTGIQVWISMITHGHSVPRLVGYYMLLWAPWIAWSGLVVWLSRRWPFTTHRPRNVAIHFLAAIVLALATSSWWIVLTVWMQPFDRMTGGFSSRLAAVGFLIAQMPIELVVYGGVLAALRAGAFYRRVREREAHTANLEAALVNARLQALELQIQPHFLFNTLHAVSSLVRAGKPHEAVVMIAGLSDLLRYTLDHAGQQSVTLDEEGAMLRLYFEIQRTRFPDRLSFGIDIAPDVRRAAVPTLILQPLAENAIRHGIGCSAAAGEVSVHAFRENGALRIDMFNSGSLRNGREGVGLRNTRERLRQIYGDAQRFDLRECGDGVVASLSIPCREVG